VKIENHGRRIDCVERRDAPKKESAWIQALRAREREEDAVRALVAFALHLAGTDKLPSRAPVGGGNAPLHVPEPLPRVRRPTLGRVWTKDIRPGPHDVLTWDDAMQVPWVDGTGSGSGDAPKKIETLPQHLKDQIDLWGLMIPSYAVEDDVGQ
jgi:hypothetical protein